MLLFACLCAQRRLVSNLNGRFLRPVRVASVREKASREEEEEEEEENEELKYWKTKFELLPKRLR